MTRDEEMLLDALRCAVHGEALQRDTLSRAEKYRLLRLARAHYVLPLVAEAIYASLDPSDRFYFMLVRQAKQLTIRQARRTGDFLLLYEELLRRGLQPAVVKGIVLRSLYPQPEQRASVDEDLLVAPSDFLRYHQALTACGMTPTEPVDLSRSYDEVSYWDDERHLYLELHMALLPSSDAYGDCNAPFVGALDRTVTVQIDDVLVRTLSPTDHLLFLICHAYKHFLHAGVGVRQLCDICLFVRKYCTELDMDRILSACRQLHIDRFSAALFRIGEVYLDFPAPAAFVRCEDDIAPLLEDILSGGLYGVEDINRAHSSTLTLEAVAAQRLGRRRGGVLRSVFLPLSSMAGKYPYLRRHKWLLPVAWTQRVWDYLFRQNDVDPAQSVRIAQKRIELLKNYGIIEQ